MGLDVFLFGAGASAPLGLPVSRGFLSDFEPSSLQLLNLLIRYTKAKTLENLDIEEVFSLLQEAIESENSLIFAIFEKNSGWFPKDGWKRISERGITTSVNEEVKQILRQFFSEAKSLFFEIKRFILKTLSEFSPESAFNLYWSFFKDYPFKEKPLLIFTTNYDLVIEEAFLGKTLLLLKEWKAIGVDRIYTGFEPKDLGYVFDFDRAKLQNPGTVAVIKLHGSINWRPHEGLILLGDKSVPDDPDVPFLIYPGYKGVPDREPFLSLHLAFLDILTKARRLISIGFAFRDLYINSIVHHALSLNEKLKIHAVAPEFPEDSLFPKLREKFPKRVFHHQERVELQDGEVKPNLWNLIRETESE